MVVPAAEASLNECQEKNPKSQAAFPLHTQICFLLRPSLVKWFPVTNCSNCQTQTLHFCSFLPACLQAPWAALHWGEAQLARPHRWTHNCPPRSTSILQHPRTQHWHPRTTLCLLTRASLHTSGLRRQNFPFHDFEGCGCLFGLTPHVSLSQIVRPFVQGVGSLL